jgi:hypothetical protein
VGFVREEYTFRDGDKPLTPVDYFGDRGPERDRDFKVDALHPRDRWIPDRCRVIPYSCCNCSEKIAST